MKQIITLEKWREIHENDLYNLYTLFMDYLQKNKLKNWLNKPEDLELMFDHFLYCNSSKIIPNYLKNDYKSEEFSNELRDSLDD